MSKAIGLEPPKNINVYYIVSIYRDMELADEIEFSETFENYLMAKMFYEKEIKKAKHEYFITFEIEIEQEINEGKFETETIRIADNFIEK